MSDSKHLVHLGRSEASCRHFQKEVLTYTPRVLQVWVQYIEEIAIVWRDIPVGASQRKRVSHRDNPRKREHPHEREHPREREHPCNNIPVRAYTLCYVILFTYESCYSFKKYLCRSFQLKPLSQVLKILFSVIRFYKISKFKEHYSLVWEDVSILPEKLAPMGWILFH